MDNQDLICTATGRIRSQWQQNPWTPYRRSPFFLFPSRLVSHWYARFGVEGDSRKEEGGRRKGRIWKEWMCWYLHWRRRGSMRVARDSLNLAFTNQRAAATTGRRVARKRQRRKLNERSGPIPLSFFPCLCAPRQPTGQKEGAEAGGKESLGSRGEKKEETRHSGEIRASRVEGNKTEEQGVRGGSVWILRFPASHWFTSCLGIGRKKRLRKKPAREERAVEGDSCAISAVCMRGRRQTLLNCPMTPYIPFYRCALLHPLFRPAAEPSELYRSRRKLTSSPSRRKAPYERNNTPRASELRCLERESLGKSSLIGARWKLTRVNHISREKSMRWINEGV